MNKFGLISFVLVMLFGLTHGIHAEGADSALKFDGVDDFVTAGTPDVVAGGAGNNGITLSAWIKADDFGVHDARIITKASGVAEQDHYWMLSTFESDGIKLRFRLKTSDGGTTTCIASSGNLTAGEWTHVAATYDGSNMVIYKNGVEVGSTPKTGTIERNNGLVAMIGNNPPSATSRPFDGIIEEVLVLNSAFTTEKIREKMHLIHPRGKPELVGYWRMNEGTGTTTRDWSGNEHTGILSNGPTWITSTAPLGSGDSYTQTVSTTGWVEFEGAAVDMNVSSKAGTDDIVVTRISSLPGGTQPTGVTSVYPRYWVVRSYGGGSCTTDMIFIMGGATISSEDQSTPSNLKLFRRDFNSDGSWTQVASASSATSSSVTFDGISSFGQFAIGTTGGSPLPIQLAHFSAIASPSSNDVQIEWGTVTETNNYGFYVQQSLSATTEFIDLPNSFVPGHGTSLTPHEYSWAHTNVPAGVYYYRLKQIDLDGTVHYTDGQEITVGSPTSVNEQNAPKVFALQQNYPNPFNPSTIIRFSVENTGAATLEVFNVLGERVATLFSGFAEAGKQYSATFEADNLTNGAYFYKLTSNGKSSLRKMVLLK